MNATEAKFQTRDKLMMSAKQMLVRLGPDSPLTRGALNLHARQRGFRIAFGEAISISRGSSVMRLSKSALQMVPYMLDYFDLYFSSFEPSAENGLALLDFSSPRFHRYRKTGVEFYFPSIPEEEYGGQYTSHYCPGPGDVVFDLGANAGATAWYFSNMVGDAGRVFAFEPDDCNYECLLRNIEHHGLKNVVPLKKALGGFTGSAVFNMDGTLAAGLADLVAYTKASQLRTVDVLTLADACALAGAVPRFIKMDVEGAEISIVSQSLDFLRANPVHFTVDSSHVVGGRMTHFALDRLFSSIGYSVESSAESGQMFTWAAPAPASVRPN